MRRCIRDGAATLQKVVTGRCVPEFYCWMPSSGAHAVQQSTCLAHTEKKMHRHAAAAHSSRGFADRFATFHRKIPRQSSEPYFNLPFLDLLQTPLVVNYAASDAPATLSQGWSSSSVSQPDLIFTTLYGEYRLRISSHPQKSPICLLWRRLTWMEWRSVRFLRYIVVILIGL